METASIALPSPGPRIATTTIASSRLGSASMMSISRMIRISTAPPAKPAARPNATPSASDRVTTISPISSDSRAPWIRRDRMSRPTSSVPSGNCRLPPSIQAGGASRRSRNCSNGEWGAISGARSATRAIRMMMISPATAPLFSAKLREKAPSGPGGGAATSVAAVSSVLSVSVIPFPSPSMPDARIEGAVEQIDQQIDRHDRGRDQQHATLENGIVPAADALDQPFADAGPGEDRLGQDGAAEQRPDLKPDHRDHGDQRVAQGMQPDHAQAAETLGARRADVVLAQYLQHRR